LLQKNQQWGKLLSEIKNYQKRFPKNKHAELLVSYALGALIKEGNLSAIEDFMLNFPVGKVKFQELYQSTCYEIGNKAYDKRDDRKASTYFKKSLDFPVNREMAWYARYAMAEMAARINRNSDAIKLYIPLLAETSLPNGSRELSQRIRLSLAYSFAYITFYDRSLQYFEEYMANKLPGQRSVEDLKNLAEISIANGNLVGGMKLFDEAIGQNTPQTAELIDRKFAIYNGLRKYKEAAAVYQEYLAKFPNLTTADQVFYQMNVALAKLQKSENYAQVISNASQFIQQKSPANPYFAPVLLLRAQAYQNTNQWFLALDDYTMIVRKYTTDSSAKEAIIGANDLLRKASRFAEVLELNRIYANQHGEDPTMADQWFDICVEMFRQEKYKLLVPELVRFIQEHPKYDQLDEINYMLGVSTYHTKDLTNALVYLKRSQQSSTFANKSQWMIALVHEQQKNLDLAVNQLVDLKANISYQDTLTQHVQDKLKQIYLHQQKFDALSKLWLDVDPADSTRRSQWALEIGQNAFDMQSYPLALSWFEKSVTFDADEVGAKAAIAYAKVKALQKDWSGSNAWLTSQFIQDGSRYFHLSDAIVGLAFIQMAENFVQLKNVPQAKAILQSILANSSDDAVKVIAKKKMDEIQ
jgi:predicted negative regulator of RcsB-dependent stress response